MRNSRNQLSLSISFSTDFIYLFIRPKLIWVWWCNYMCFEQVKSHASEKPECNINIVHSWCAFCIELNFIYWVREPWNPAQLGSPARPCEQICPIGAKETYTQASTKDSYTMYTFMWVHSWRKILSEPTFEWNLWNKFGSSLRFVASVTN